MITITLDKVKFDLKESHNFEWLNNLGETFCVFDENDSGNISFGIINENKKYFVKYAGAKTKEYEGDIQAAIDNLTHSIAIYKDLEQKDLIRFIKVIKTPSGLATIFEWFEGDCLFAHWTFGKWDRYTSPNSPYYKYKNLSLEKRLKSIETIFEFLTFVEEKNYVAVDFYDGSILYDFENDITKICDIDFFRKKPTINDVGEDYWGSRRMKAPEEYILNATIDSDTNVFGLGRLILGLLGDEKDYSIEKWEGSKVLYDVLMKATEFDRTKRFQTLKEFYVEWKRQSV